MRQLAACFFALCLAACVTPVPLQSSLVELTTPSPVYRLDQTVSVTRLGAAAQQLRAGTTWRKIGDIAQGSVYRTKDQVVIVNSFNVFEADIVVNAGQVVGYFVPVQRGFVAADHVTISFKEEKPANDR